MVPALDSVVLGCTHYPLVEPLFRAALPANTRIVSQPLRTADSLTAYLFRHPEMKRLGALPAEIRAYTTGDPDQVDGACQPLLLPASSLRNRCPLMPIGCKHHA